MNRWGTRKIAREKKKIPQSTKKNIIQDGGPSYKDSGPSAKKISQNTELLRGMTENIGSTVKEGTILMGLSILCNVFDNVLKCPDCGCDIKSHADMCQHVDTQMWIFQLPRVTMRKYGV